MQLNFGLFFTVFLLLVQIALGAYVLLRTSRNKTSFSFACFCLSLSLWAFPAYMLQSAASLQGVEFWGRYIFLGPVLIAYFFLYFTFVFPKGEMKRSLSLILFLPMIIFLFLVPSSLILKKGVLSTSGPVPVWGPAYPWFAFYFLSYFLWGVYNLFQKYRINRGIERTQIKYVFTGLFLSFLFGIIFNLILPALGIARFLNIGPFFTLILVAFTAYAIVKTHLMDISVIISRAVAEVLTVLFEGTIYLGLVYFYRTYVSTSIDWPFLTWTVIYGILVGQTYQRTRLFIQTTSDKVFLRGRYNYYKELSDASSHVGEKLSLPDILRVLYDTFANVVEISVPRVFLPENFTEMEKTSNRYLVYDKKTFLPDTAGGEVSINNPLTKELIKKREPLQEVKELDAALVVPCLLEDRLIGFFALGRKLSEDLYTDEDMRLLKTLANQAAITLDHTRSYEKIKVELESVGRQLERSQRLASLGTLTAGVTHEIRNPLTVIRIETERLAMEPRGLEYLKQHRDLLLKHIDRISGIVNRMLGLAKDKPKRQAAVNVNELLNSTLELFSISNITVKKNFLAVPEINGDPEALQEALVNLIQNAIDAMLEGGTLTLCTYLEDNRVAVEIRDTGKGIPDEIREKIFDPFYSTRHEGVGLGLSIAYRIIREHGGDIRVTSEIGKGSTFKILF